MRFKSTYIFICKCNFVSKIYNKLPKGLICKRCGKTLLYSTLEIFGKYTNTTITAKEIIILRNRIKND